MQKKPLTLTNGKEPIEARQDVNEKLKGNTAGQQAQQDDHIFNTNGHSVTPSKFDVLSRRCVYREIWERSRFTAGLDIYLRIAIFPALTDELQKKRKDKGRRRSGLFYFR